MTDDSSPAPARESVADQVACTEAILDITPDAAIVSNLGVASYVLAGVEDRARNFYQWGAMGVTTPVGLGLALSTDDPVTVLDGDGSMLMSLGALSTVGSYDPENLVIVLFNNRQYGTTGGQDNHSDTTDFVGVAESCGVAAVHVTDDGEFREAYQTAVDADESVLLVCEVAPLDPDARPPFDFAHIKRRVRDALTAGDG